MLKHVQKCIPELGPKYIFCTEVVGILVVYKLKEFTFWGGDQIWNKAKIQLH